MTAEDWFDEGRRTIGMWIDGSTSLSRDREGELVPDDSWLVLLHAGAERTDVTLPGSEFGEKFVPVLDTGARRGTPASDTALPPGTTLTLPPRSLLLFRTPRAV
jgi:glycogen operon protein